LTFRKPYQKQSFYYSRQVETEEIHSTGRNTMSQFTPSEKRDFDPNRLFDTLLARLRLENDAALSRALTVAQPVISKIRRRQLPVGGLMLIRMQEISNLSVQELRELMGDRRTKCRLSITRRRPARIKNVRGGAVRPLVSKQA
jgi:hypothetical protein